MTDGAKVISRRWPLVSGLALLGLVVGAGILLAARHTVPELDTEWMAEIIEHRSPLWLVPSLVMNFVGGGWFALVLPVAIASALCLARRYWCALFFIGSTVVSAALVQLLKVVFGRPRPLEQLVTSDFGSFPSGHVANAATMAVALSIIFSRVWVWAAGVAYTVLMLLSRTYLGVHWLTDTVGGLLLGTAVVVILWAPLAYRLHHERLRRVPPARRAR